MSIRCTDCGKLPAMCKCLPHVERVKQLRNRYNHTNTIAAYIAANISETAERSRTQRKILSALKDRTAQTRKMGLAEYD